MFVGMFVVVMSAVFVGFLLVSVTDMRRRHQVLIVAGGKPDCSEDFRSLLNDE